MENQLDKTLLWEVVEKPVSINENHAGAFKALTRSDNNEVISIMSSSYYTFSNEEFVELVDKLAEISGMDAIGFADFSGGKRVMGYLKSKQEATIGKDRFKDYMIVANSHDGSNKLFVGAANVIYRCENMFSQKVRSFEAKHSSKMGDRLLELTEYIKAYKYGRKEMYDNMSTFLSIAVDELIIKHFVSTVLELHKLLNPEKSPRKLMLEQSINHEMKALGKNLYGLFNGLTHYTSHRMNLQNRSFGSVNGSAYKLNEMGYKYCLGLINRRSYLVGKQAV